MKSHNGETWMRQALDALDGQDRLRVLVGADLLPNGCIRMEGRVLLNLSSNDYLGCAGLFKADPLGVGAGASRLVTGNHEPLRVLEQELAELHGTEDSLVFGSGFLANLGVISCMVGKGDVIFSDKLNHASIVDGALLSKAKHVRYRHGDMEHLAHLLSRHVDCRRKLIVSDAIFSMDGDRANLIELVGLKNRHGAMLMVDEAHSGGVLGPQGAGLAAEIGIADEVDVHMGTLSKAYGCYGAYVCGSATLKQFLVNHARSLIYSTALPPVIAAAAHKTVKWSRSADDKRQLLQRKSKLFREELRRAGLDCGPSVSQIVPVIIGSDTDALSICKRLRGDGIAAVAIRPPTVPEGGARIRFSLSADHRDDQLANAVTAIVRRVREINQETG